MRKRVLRDLLMDEKNKRKHAEMMLDHSEKRVLALQEELRRLRGEQYERSQRSYKDPEWEPFRRA
jgi:hypothetical protein